MDNLPQFIQLFALVVHIFNPSTQEAKAMTVSSRPALSTFDVQISHGYIVRPCVSNKTK